MGRAYARRQGLGSGTVETSWGRRRGDADGRMLVVDAAQRKEETSRVGRRSAILERLNG